MEDRLIEMTVARAIARLRNDDVGITLIELLVASAMTIVITGAAVSLMVSSLHRQQDISSRSDRIGEARSAIEKLTVDLRQGSKVTTAGASAMSLETYCDNSVGVSEKCTVSYSCVTEATARYKCTRSVNGATAKLAISGLSSPNVFSFTPNSTEPTYVGVEVKIPSREGGGATLQGGAALHNFGL